MKETYWGYWLIMLGVFVVVIMMLISNLTTQNTEDYYLIQEVTEAAMVDAVNYGYYREYGELKIDREKFIESFLRRFAENVSLNTYEISFYGIYEAPPKVSVRVASKTKTFIVAGDQTTFDIVNKVDAVLELSGQREVHGSGSGNSSNNNNSSSSSTNNSNGSNNGQNQSSSSSNTNTNETSAATLLRKTLYKEIYNFYDCVSNCNVPNSTQIYKKRDYNSFLTLAVRRYTSLYGNEDKTRTEAIEVFNDLPNETTGEDLLFNYYYKFR